MPLRFSGFLRMKWALVATFFCFLALPAFAQIGEEELDEDQPNRLFVEKDWVKWPATRHKHDTIRKLAVDDVDAFDPELLKNFPGLTGLIITDTKLNDLRFLRYLPKLTIFEIHGNSLTTAAGIETAVNLEEVSIANNFLTSAEPLRGLNKIRRLQLYDNDITDISPIQGLKNITSLDLGKNPITSIEPLREFTQLRLFSVYEDSFLTDIDLIRNFKQVNDLNISLLKLDNFTLSTVTTMKGMKNLRIQGMVKSNRELEWIKYLTEIEQLTMGLNDSLTCIDSLWRLKKLKYLDIHSNNVKKIEILRGFHALVKIVMYTNLVEDISPLEGCPELKSLYLYNNPINDYSVIYKMRNLQYLHVNLEDFNALQQQQIRHRLPYTKISFY